jgi:predicted  nucleic acid-binding Zn-ribbon protein
VSTSAENSPFQVLLALQALDSEADQLRYHSTHHPAQLRLDELSTRHRALREAAHPLEAEAGALQARQSEFERELGETASRIAQIEARVRAGAAGSFRDVGAIAEEIEHLKGRGSHLEDELLEVMEALDVPEGELARIGEEDAALVAEGQSRQRELAVARAEIDAELAVLDERRAALAQNLAPTVLAEYERLRERLGGVAVAHVEHGMCTGCNLALAAGERDRLNHGGANLAHCEQCGRILIP